MNTQKDATTIAELTCQSASAAHAFVFSSLFLHQLWWWSHWIRNHWETRPPHTLQKGTLDRTTDSFSYSSTSQNLNQQWQNLYSLKNIELSMMRIINDNLQQGGVLRQRLSHHAVVFLLGHHTFCVFIQKYALLKALVCEKPNIGWKKGHPSSG